MLCQTFSHRNNHSAVLGKLLFKSNLLSYKLLHEKSNVLQLLLHFKSNKVLCYMIYIINCRVCKFYFNYKYPMLS